MATKKDFVEFVCENIKFHGEIKYKKMFGEYVVYADEKPVLLVCDDTVFVKILPATECFAETCEKGYPYDGAKEHYIIDLDDAEKLNQAVSVMRCITTAKKGKK